MKITSATASDYQTCQTASGTADTMTISDFKEQLLAKIKSGNTAPKFQIGSQEFTIKEWDKFLERFDSSEDTVRKALEEESEKRYA